MKEKTMNDTAIQTINTLPETAEDVIAVMNSGNGELVERAYGATISTEQELSVAADLLAELSTREKAYEAERKGLTKPINDSVKNINAKFKQAQQPLQDAIAALKPKIGKYQAAIQAEKQRIAEEERKVREAELKAKAEAEAAKGNEEGAARLEDMATKTVAKVEETGRGGFSGAKTSVVKIWKFEVTDIEAFAKAHPGLIQIDTVKVNKLIKGGERKIDGLHIFSEDNVRIRA